MMSNQLSALATLLGLLLCLVSAAAGAEPVDEVDLLQQLRTAAQAELDVVAAEHNYQQQRVDALQELRELGHATFRELATSQLELRAQQARLDAAEHLIHFIDRIAASASKQGIATNGSILLVSIPGLMEQAETRPLATLSLPLTQRAREILEAIPLASSSSAAGCRSAAWRELSGRLAAIDDGSTVARREQELTAFQQAVEQAREHSQGRTQIRARICRRLPPFYFAATHISSEQQLLAVVAREARRLELIAQRTTAETRMELFDELSRRATLAAKADAATPAELLALRYRQAEATHQRDRASDNLRRLADQPQRASTRFQLVTHADTIRTPMLPELSPRQLGAACKVARDRLLQAKNTADDVLGRRRSLTAQVAHIREVAEKDRWFAGELRRAERLLDIANAETEHAEFERTQRQHEYKFVSAVRDLEQRSDASASIDWRTPLVQLFRARASSTTTENVAQKTLVLDEWRLAGLVQLRKDGHATWKEEMAARVRRNETQQRIVEARTERMIARQLAKLIGDDLKRPADHAVASVH